jgi:hypothetical protein
METTITKPKIPTELIDLPSKGLLYPKDHPLSNGKIEMCYMTARHEDIITNSNYIKQGTVIDKLLQALIVTPVNYDDILIGDKNTILVAARILGYGKDYTFTYINQDGKETSATVDLTTIENKLIDDDLYKSGINEFTFEFPYSDNTVNFKLLTHGDEKKIETEIKGLQKINPSISYDITTRLNYIITSVNGDREKKSIRDFVNNYLLAKDARALREYYSKIQPDINMKYIPQDENYAGEGIDIPVSLSFFWPDSGI